MRPAVTITALLIIAKGEAILASPPVCEVVPPPEAAVLEVYLKSGPYAKGLRLYKEGHFCKATKALEGAYEKARKRVRGPLARKECSPKAIESALTETVFKSPALLEPMDDRFLPPRPVRLAMAKALCACGDLRKSSHLLLQGALGGDEEVLIPALVLLGASGRPDLCLALLPSEGGTETTLARAYCRRLLGEAVEVPNEDEDLSRTAEVLRRLLKESSP